MIDETSQTTSRKLTSVFEYTVKVLRAPHLKVGLYEFDMPTGKWVKISGEDDHLLTLQDAVLPLDLPGGKK